ncbi:MAG: diguanylate cyclase [Actinomycetota bacterium]
MPGADSPDELQKLADYAEALSAGAGARNRLSCTGDAARVAAALERLSEQLAARNRQIAQYQAALDRAHTRFGEALRSTHDLDRMLEIALETGMEAIRARRGLLLVLKGQGTLVAGVSRNLELDSLKLAPGRGIAGHVAATGTAVVVPSSAAPERDPLEPEFSTQVSVPLFTNQRTFGVLNFYDKSQGNFTETDLRTILSLSDQAGVAIENVLLHEDAQRMAIMDGLTGIWNHRWFQIQMAQELDRAERFGRPFSLLVMDIDDFKLFNDTYGHQLGDFVLVELARRVKSSVRDVDIFARYGGEEFALLLSETDSSGSANAAEKLRLAICSTPFETSMAPEPLTVTVSIGVASFPEAASDGAGLFRAADTAMYRAKALGKNRVVVYDPAGHSS